MTKTPRTTAFVAALFVAGCALLFDQTIDGQGRGGGGDRPWGGPLAADSATARGYNDAARALARVDAHPMINWNYRIWCETGYRTVREAGAGQPIDALVDPENDLVTPKGFVIVEKSRPMPAGGIKFMDNAWYFGTDVTGAVVVRVPEGLLMFDALTNPQDMETQMLAEMKTAGLNPADFRYIFMGHQHGDHVGGANLIRQKYAPGVRFVMGQPDAAGIAEARKRVMAGEVSGRGRGGAAPSTPPTPEQIAAQRELRLMRLPDRVDIAVPAFPGMTTGMQRIRIGDQTEVVAALVPGHTVGQLAVIVPVTHKGTPHKLVIWSGNDNMTNAVQYAASFDFFRSIATIENADAYINTHAYQGDAFKHLRRLRANPETPNPFILGTDGVQRQLGILAECHRAQARRLLDGTWKAM